jgi:hypothetical protein
MNNCHVALAGGIGNQLFQVAAGYSYAKKHKKNLVLDVSSWSAGQGRNPLDYSKTIFKNFKFVTHRPDNITPIYEQRFNYDELPNEKGHVILHGYFQSLKYFEDVADEFCDLLDFSKQEHLKTKISKSPNCAVHLRRGDYIKFSNVHLVCDTNYFRNNIEKFSGYNIDVYTDSLDIAIKELDGLDVQFIDGVNELNDLYMLTLYDNMICSNSSFSWWGSFLGKKKNKIVVPNRWFNNFQDHSDIYRPDFSIYEI